MSQGASICSSHVILCAQCEDCTQIGAELQLSPASDTWVTGEFNALTLPSLTPNRFFRSVTKQKGVDGICAGYEFLSWFAPGSILNERRQLVGRKGPRRMAGGKMSALVSEILYWRRDLGLQLESFTTKVIHPKQEL